MKIYAPTGSIDKTCISKIFLVMKITLLLLIVAIIHVSAKTYAQKVNLNLKDTPLEKVFEAITTQTGYNFLYPDDLLEKIQPLNLSLKNASLNEALKKCLTDQPVTFIIKDNTIIIKKMIVVNQGVAIIGITGKVTDAKGQPLPGVTVKLKGGTAGASTDLNGAFTIKVTDQKSVLVFSFIGFVTQEVPVGNRATINIVLLESPKSLSEVVVIGYGSVTRKDLTGSVGSVNTEDLVKAPVKSFDDALAGRVAGVQVTSPDGQPGASPSITIRGGNSVTQDNSPLYVIDGFPVENYDNNSINPADIETINVLKDASSTAIYGARGANGVIIITTKKGKNGPPVVTYNAYYGVQSNINRAKLLDPYNYVKYNLEADSVLSITSPNDYAFFNVYSPTFNKTGTGSVNDYLNAPGVDWQSAVFRKAAMQSHELSIRGGTKDTRYSISGSYLGQDGTIIASGFKRYQGRVVLDQNINDKLKIGINTNYSYVVTNGIQVGGTNAQTADPFLLSVWRYRPALAPGENANNLLTQAQDAEVLTSTNYQWNPVLTATQQSNNKYTNLLTADAFVEYSFIPELKLKITGGLNTSNLEQDQFNTSLSRLGSPISSLGNGGPNGSIFRKEIDNLVNENTLTYNKLFAQKHLINVVVGVSFGKNTTSSNTFGALKVPNESLGVNGLGQGTPSLNVTTKSSNTLASLLGRINYSYDSKYLATASFRSDGSSKFLGDNTSSYFPSGSLAWHLSQEDFLKTSKIISDAKIRGSYGVIGNNRVPDTAPYALLGQGSATGVGGAYSPANILISGAYPINLANPDLKWESTAETDLGIDLGFFNQRITLTVDAYNKKTTDLLLNASLPGSTGYATAFENIGSIQNRGLEFLLSTINLTSKDFNWSSSFNISFNRNKVLSLTSGQTSLLTTVRWLSGNTVAQNPAYVARVGQPVGMFYGVMSDGVYQLSDFTLNAAGVYVLNAGVPYVGSAAATRPGNWKFKDLNGDGVIDANDQTVIGNPNPQFTGGFSNNFSYKNFDLNVFFQFTYGNQLLNVTRFLMEGGGGVGTPQGANQYAEEADRWTPTNPSNTVARAGAAGAPSYYPSRIVEDGSFLRLKTLNLGYRFNPNLLKKVNVSNLRVYASAQNLYTWTKYTGLDPEVNSFPSALTPGMDYSAYPRARVITLGLDVTF